MSKYVQDCVLSRLHCKTAKKRDIIPIPLGFTLRASKLGGLIHFDFWFTQKGEDDLAYTLIVKNDMSGYVWLQAKNVADEEGTAN